MTLRDTVSGKNENKGVKRVNEMIPHDSIGIAKANL